MYKVTQSEGFLNLSLNENYISFCQEHNVTLHDLNRYPSTEVYAKIVQEAAKLYGAQENQTLLTNGSDDGIFLIQQWFAYKFFAKGKKEEKPQAHAIRCPITRFFTKLLYREHTCHDASCTHINAHPSSPADFAIRSGFAEHRTRPSIIITDPTFSMYETYAKNLGLGVIKQKLDGNLRVNVDDLVVCIKENPNSLLFLPNPNSPTGMVLPLSEIEVILQTGTWVVIDEAYIEFAGVKSAITLLEQYQNLIVLRTLSKFYGMAAVRIGFVIGNIVNEVKRFQAPFSVSAINAEVALGTLKFVNQNQETIGNFAQKFAENRRDFLVKLKQKKNVKKVCETETNFVLFEVNNVSEVLQRFKEKKFLVKDFSPILPDTIRLALASQEVNEKILECI